MRLCRLMLILALAGKALLAQSPAAPQRYALLIGIGKYEHTAAEMKLPSNAPASGRFAPSVVFYDLHGPTHDVDNMRDLLAAYIPDPTHITVRKDEQAKHDAILADLRHTLLELPHPGDTVVIYISSHGSLRYNPDPTITERFAVEGFKDPIALENTIVPYDWYQGRDDIFSRDLRHLFNQAADRKVHVIAIFDSCYSGSLSRGVRASNVRDRDLPLDPRPLPRDTTPADPVPWERSDYPVLVLSAAQKDQSAVDIQTPPHGLFTDALIQTLRLLPPNRSVADVFERLKIAMELQPDAVGQQPKLAASANRAGLTFFGDPVVPGPVTTAVVSVSKDGQTAVLDIGPAADIGPGSIFTQLTAVNGVQATLVVGDALSIARSEAVVTVPPDGALQATDLVQLTRWFPAQHPTVSLYLGPSPPTQAELTSALQAVHTAQVELVADPTIQPWTHHLAWSGTHWLVTPHSQPAVLGATARPPAPVSLGAHLSANSFKKLPPQARVWFDVPLPRELIAAILPPPSADAPAPNAVLTSTRGNALYILAGTSPDGTATQYTWLKRDDADAERQTPPSMGPGCSASSAYPLRTNWTTTTDPETLAGDLSAKALDLSRLNDWLQLAHSAVAGQTDFPYQLAIRSVADNRTVLDGGTTPEASDAYVFDLVGKPRSNVKPKWVYVIDIDCQGKGSVIWPYRSIVAEQYPKNGDPHGAPQPRIQLPGKPFTVNAPFGYDTYVLLTTSTPITHPEALNFTGVVTRSATAAPTDPLEELLFSASAGTRSPTSRGAPTNWSVQTISVLSIAAPTAATKP